MADAAQLREMVRDLHDNVEELERSQQYAPVDRANEAQAAAAVVGGNVMNDGGGGAVAERARAFDDAVRARTDEYQRADAAVAGQGNPATGAPGTGVQALDHALQTSPTLSPDVRQAGENYRDAVLKLSEGLQERDQARFGLFQAEQELQSAAATPGSYTADQVHILATNVEALAQKMQAADTRVNDLREEVRSAEDEFEAATADIPEPPSATTEPPVATPAPPAGVAQPLVATPADPSDPSGLQFAVPDDPHAAGDQFGDPGIEQPPDPNGDVFADPSQNAVPAPSASSQPEPDSPASEIAPDDMSPGH